MTYAAIALSWAVVLVLLWVLLAEQPAGVAEVYARDAALSATVTAIPTVPRPTPERCYQGTVMGICRP